MFTTEFDRYVVVGESITCQVDGFTVRATLHHDEDTTPEEGSPNYDSWLKDDWHYFGVVVTVWREGVNLTDDFAFALWGIEGNFPLPDRKANPNLYFREVANEQLAEAVAAAKARIHKWAKEIA